jgi:hypothetical protein
MEIKSQVVSDFNGWSGNTLFELQNGQIWKQDEYQYWYHYAYRPVVIIKRDNGTYKMFYKNKSIKVRRMV